MVFSSIHAEKPTENALKVNAKIVSIYEHRYTSGDGVSVPIGQMLGEEVENEEVIYSDHGLFLYRAYSCGHIRAVGNLLQGTSY